MDHHFQVNLRGIVDLLSNHLYSGPQVFVRELLQNAVDAIRAREKVQPNLQGEISIELTRSRVGAPATLVVTDNGIGLSEEELHRFLATIGESSKRELDGQRLTDFIGQFGIGLLSCFMVTDEIVVITRSARADAAAVEWRGKASGDYTVKTLDATISPGTQVYLTCKDESDDYFDQDLLIELAKQYGGLLPDPIRFTCGKTAELINPEPPPWRQAFASPAARTQALLAYGQSVFGERFFDAISLDDSVPGVDGVAFVLNESPNATARQRHRVYLKNMFLTDGVDNLLPPWAIFVRLVLNVTNLKPTASREGFQENATLDETREALGDCLRRYLVQLSERDPDKLMRLILIHDLTIKALAVADDEFYRLVFDWLPVETSDGHMTLGEYRRHHDVLRYAPTLDQFRQIAQVAAAQRICVVNGGYTYVTELLERYPEIFDEGRVERIEASDVIESFKDLSEAEQDEAEDFVRLAEKALRPYRCHVDVKRFSPTDLPVFYTTSAEGNFFRSVQQSKDVANPLWSSVLDSIAPQFHADKSFSHLCLNFGNRMIRRLSQSRSPEISRRAVHMLYVQALLLGHHPLNSQELKLLNDGLLSLIDFSLNATEPA